MLFYLDYLALCSQDYQFFHRFSAEWDEGSALMLPNWGFSVALAKFQQHRPPPGNANSFRRSWRWPARLPMCSCRQLRHFPLRGASAWRDHLALELLGGATHWAFSMALAKFQQRKPLPAACRQLI